jgi:hypothetical protein
MKIHRVRRKSSAAVNAREIFQFLQKGSSSLSMPLVPSSVLVGIALIVFLLVPFDAGFAPTLPPTLCLVPKGELSFVFVLTASGACRHGFTIPRLKTKPHPEPLPGIEPDSPAYGAGTSPFTLQRQRTESRPWGSNPPLPAYKAGAPPLGPGRQQQSSIFSVTPRGDDPPSPG